MEKILCYHENEVRTIKSLCLAHLLYNGLLLVKALFGSGLRDAAGRAAKLPGDLLALGLGRELGHLLAVRPAHLAGPRGALLLGGVALGHVLALLLLLKIN